MPTSEEQVSLEETGKDKHYISCRYQSHQVWGGKGFEPAIPVYKGTRRQRCSACQERERVNERAFQVHQVFQVFNNI